LALFETIENGRKEQERKKHLNFVTSIIFLSKNIRNGAKVRGIHRFFNPLKN